MTAVKKASLQQEVFSKEEELLLSQCSDFPLASKKKAREKGKPKEVEFDPTHWANALIRMNLYEAAQRLENYKKDIESIYNLSKNGDQNAIELLYRFAEISTMALEFLADQNPELLHHISKKTLLWPARIGLKKISKTKNNYLLKSLKLGEESPFNHHWNPESPATFTAHTMVYWLIKHQKILQLPPLINDAETVNTWFEWGWKGLSYQLKGNPEKYPYMRELVEKHAEKESARKQEKRNPETVIRGKMKAAVKQSFLQYLKNIP